MERNRRLIKKTVLIIVITVISLISLAPFYIMLVMSSHVTEDIFKGLVLLPGNYLMENIKTAVESGLLTYYRNSIIVSVSSTVLSVLVSSLAGYAIAKYRFKFRDAVFNFILVTMMVPTQLGLVAYVAQMRIMGVSNSLWPLIFPWIANGFGVFWMTQYIQSSVPDEIIESGRLDGCSEPGIFFKLVIPCCIPALTTLVMLIFLWSWNNYMLPMVTLNKPELFTIPVGLARIGDLYRVDHAARIAGLALGTLPIIVIFSIGSKSFIRGLTAGAVKE